MASFERTFKLANARLFESRQQPWRGSDFRCDVPTMMVEDELLFLHYLTSQHYRGSGAIVDLGPLGGASTYCLAAGLRNFGHIFSYDLWYFYPSWDVLFPNRVLHPGDDLLPLFLENIAQYRRRVTPQKGDLTSRTWNHGPIEIMFVDAAKSPQSMWHIVNEFFPHLVPGGFVIHQDYVSAECPWIHMVTSCLADYFEPCDSPTGGSVCFRLKRKIPSGILVSDFFESIPIETARLLLFEASDILVDWFRLCVNLSEANYLIYMQRLDEGAGILAEVSCAPSFSEGVFNDVELVRFALNNERAGIRRPLP